MDEKLKLLYWRSWLNQYHWDNRLLELRSSTYSVCFLSHETNFIIVTCLFSNLDKPPQDVVSDILAVRSYM